MGKNNRRKNKVANKSSSTKVPKNDIEQENRKKMALDISKYILVFIFSFWVKTILGAGLLASTLFLISYLFYVPEPEVKITETFDSLQMTSYEIQVMNPSLMDIHQLTIAFRFDENYPVSSYYLDEPQYKTGFVLKHGFIARLSISVGDIKSEKPFYNPFKFSSGVQAITSKLASDSSATFYVNIDKKYNGPKEQIFPNCLKKALRSNSYFIKYKYMPLGELAQIAITKKGCYDFDGYRTKADNYGKVYKQKIVGPEGKSETFGIVSDKGGLLNVNLLQTNSS